MRDRYQILTRDIINAIRKIIRGDLIQDELKNARADFIRFNIREIEQELEQKSIIENQNKIKIFMKNLEKVAVYFQLYTNENQIEPLIEILNKIDNDRIDMKSLAIELQKISDSILVRHNIMADNKGSLSGKEKDEKFSDKGKDINARILEKIKLIEKQLKLAKLTLVLQDIEIYKEFLKSYRDFFIQLRSLEQVVAQFCLSQLNKSDKLNKFRNENEKYLKNCLKRVSEYCNTKKQILEIPLVFLSKKQEDLGMLEEVKLDVSYQWGATSATDRFDFYWHFMNYFYEVLGRIDDNIKDRKKILPVENYQLDVKIKRFEELKEELREYWVWQIVRQNIAKSEFLVNASACLGAGRGKKITLNGQSYRVPDHIAELYEAEYFPQMKEALEAALIHNPGLFGVGRRDPLVQELYQDLLENFDRLEPKEFKEPEESKESEDPDAHKIVGNIINSFNKFNEKVEAKLKRVEKKPKCQIF